MSTNINLTPALEQMRRQSREFIRTQLKQGMDDCKLETKQFLHREMEQMAKKSFEKIWRSFLNEFLRNSVDEQIDLAYVKLSNHLATENEKILNVLVDELVLQFNKHNMQLLNCRQDKQPQQNLFSQLNPQVSPQFSAYGQSLPQFSQHLSSFNVVGPPNVSLVPQQKQIHERQQQEQMQQQQNQLSPQRPNLLECLPMSLVEAQLQSMTSQGKHQQVLTQHLVQQQLAQQQQITQRPRDRNQINSAELLHRHMSLPDVLSQQFVRPPNYASSRHDQTQQQVQNHPQQAIQMVQQLQNSQHLPNLQKDFEIQQQQPNPQRMLQNLPMLQQQLNVTQNVHPRNSIIIMHQTGQSQHASTQVPTNSQQNIVHQQAVQQIPVQPSPQTPPTCNAQFCNPSTTQSPVQVTSPNACTVSRSSTRSTISYRTNTCQSASSKSSATTASCVSPMTTRTSRSYLPITPLQTNSSTANTPSPPISSSLKSKLSMPNMNNLLKQLSQPEPSTNPSPQPAPFQRQASAPQLSVSSGPLPSGLNSNSPFSKDTVPNDPNYEPISPALASTAAEPSDVQPDLNVQIHQTETRPVSQKITVEHQAEQTESTESIPTVAQHDPIDDRPPPSVHQPHRCNDSCSTNCDQEDDCNCEECKQSNEPDVLKSKNQNQSNLSMQNFNSEQNQDTQHMQHSTKVIKPDPDAHVVVIEESPDAVKIKVNEQQVVNLHQNHDQNQVIEHQVDPCQLSSDQVHMNQNQSGDVNNGQVNVQENMNREELTSQLRTNGMNSLVSEIDEHQSNDYSTDHQEQTASNGPIVAEVSNLSSQRAHHSSAQPQISLESSSTENHSKARKRFRAQVAIEQSKLSQLHKTTKSLERKAQRKRKNGLKNQQKHQEFPSSSKTVQSSFAASTQISTNRASIKATTANDLTNSNSTKSSSPSSRQQLSSQSQVNDISSRPSTSHSSSASVSESSTSGTKRSLEMPLT